MIETKDTTKPQEPSVPGNMPEGAHETETSEIISNAEVMKYGANSK